MRVVIAGAGDVGYRVARDLVNRGHGVSIIDSDPAAIKRAQGLDVQVIQGHAAAPKLLVEQAGLAEADLFIGVTGNDMSQFTDWSRQVVVYPPKYKAGDLIFPFAEASK